MACELVRAAVAHSRHLVELYTDASRTRRGPIPTRHEADELSSVGSAGNATANKGDTLLEGDVFVRVVDSERWGASTEGISDSGPGSERSRENSDGILGRLRMLAETAAGSNVSSPEGGAQQACLVLVARIAEDAMMLCRDGAPFLAQALTTMPNPEDLKLPAEIEPAVASAVAIPGEASSERQPSSSDEKHGQSTLDPAWVFTGVIEALVLTGAFLATTVVRSGKQRGIGNSLSHMAEETSTGAVQGSSPVVAGEQRGSQTSLSCTGNIVARQLKLLHQTAFSSCAPSLNYRREHDPNRLASCSPVAGGDSGTSAGARDTNSVAGGDGTRGRCSCGEESTVTWFAIPFTSGCMPIVNLRGMAPDARRAPNMQREPGCMSVDHPNAGENAKRSAQHQTTARKVSIQILVHEILANKMRYPRGRAEYAVRYLFSTPWTI